jgi:hypothetical protein
MSVRSIASVLAEVAGREPVNGTRVIGIDGPSGGGKSTLARRFAQCSAATLVEVDDFVAWSDFSGWWPRFDAEVLTPLLSGRDASYRARDWEGDEFGTSLGGWKTARWSPLVIVEGVTCTRRAVVDRLTYSIWVDTPADVRLARGLARDGGDHRQLWLDWQREEQRFFGGDETRSRADLRVDGDPATAHDPLSQIVLSDP